MEKSNAQKTFGTLVGKKILIVDDEQLNQLVIKNMIKLWGAECDTADSGDKAIERVKEENYDIVLMDLMMPGLDGYQTADIIRNEIEEPKNQIPILALTGSSENASYNKIKSSGINDYSAKPFRIEDLHSKISRLIFEPSDQSVITNSEDKQIINLNYLKESTSNNPLLIKEIISIFLNQTPEFLEKIREAVNSENWDEVKTVAHKMKPTVSYVGISSIEEVIAKIEDYSEKKIHLEDIPDLFENLKKRCETAFIELRKELEEISE